MAHAPIIHLFGTLLMEQASIRSEGVRMRRVLFLIALWILVLTACGPVTPVATEEPASPEEETTSMPADLTPAQLAAITSLSEKLSIAADEIKLVSTEAVTWPDGCLGIVRMGVMCTQAEVPGFKIMLDANGQEYEFHTNQDGSVVLPAESAQEVGAAEETVIKQLAANLGLQESEITVVSSQEIEFGDACLGVALEGVMCAQVVTPGRIIVLEANDVEYEYHTSQNGSRIQPATLGLVWKREGGIAGFCDTMVIFRSGEVLSSSCKSQDEGKMGTFADLLTAREIRQFKDWTAELGEAKLDASDPKGVADRMVVTLEFFGIGAEEPTEAEQQALFEFAQDLYQRLVQ
jgi:hypothetical protein